MAKVGRPRGSARSAYHPRKDKGAKRGSYNTLPQEQRGKQPKEKKVVGRFWREYKMEDIEFLSEEDLDILIESFMKNFIERQLEQNHRWYFPE